MTMGFIRREDRSPLYEEVVRLLHRLASTDLDAASRAYAEAVQDFLRGTWAKGLEVRETNGHACLRRLLGKRCDAKPFTHKHGTNKDHIPGDLPDEDHVSLWLKGRKPHIYVSQPYELDWNKLQRLVEFCRRYGLVACVSAFPAWHFAGRALMVVIRRKKEGR